MVSNNQGSITRPEERFAEKVLVRVLGIVVTQRDNNTQPRMVDALFDLPDGRRGAMEVTTIGDEGALETEGLARKMRWTLKGATWAWIVHVGPGVSFKELKRHLPVIALTCERHGVREPELIPWADTDHLAFRWLYSVDVSVRGYPNSRRSGVVEVLPKGGGGLISEHLDDLPTWLEARLAQPDLLENLAKLAATGREEQHLFLLVHDTALPFALYHPLAWSDLLPKDSLRAPVGLTGLWLAPQWKNPILWWASAAGWSREAVD
jgi:hypothetical protein